MKKLILLVPFVIASVSALYAGDCCSSEAAVSASASAVVPVQIEKAQFPAEGVNAEYVQKAAAAGCPATAAIQARMKAASKDSCCSSEVKEASAKPAKADDCCSAELAVAEAQSSDSDGCCSKESDCSSEKCTVVAVDTESEAADSTQG